MNQSEKNESYIHGSCTVCRKKRNLRLQPKQGYENRYNIVDRSSGSFNFCKIKQRSVFGTFERFLINLLKLSANLKCSPVTIMCRNDELSWLFTDSVLPDT